MTDKEKINVDEVKETDSNNSLETEANDSKSEDVKQDEKEKKTEVEKEPEKKVEEEAKIDIEQLKAELNAANEKAKQVESLTATVEQMKVESEKDKAELKEYEDLVSNLIDTKLKEVPEDYKELIPDNLTLKQKLNWLEKAEAKGLFVKKEKKKPDVEIGKPMNIETPSVDTSKLTTGQLLRMAYNTVKK